MKIVPTYTPEVDGRGWKDESNWPATPVSEAEVRDRLQTQHDQAIDYVNRYVNTATDTGTANNLVVSFDPAPVSYAAGYELLVKAKYANTGACQINVNGLGNKAIKKNVSADLESGDIVANQYIHLKYDGTYFQILNPGNAIGIIRARGFYSDLAAWYTQNIKQILTFDSSGDPGVTFTGGAYNTTYFKVGDASRGCTDAAGTQVMLMSWATNINLTAFNDGSASATSDYIVLCIYIGGTEPSPYISVEFSTSNTGSDIDTNEFQYNISSASYAPGYNFIKVAKSAFAITGSPSWDSLGYLRLFYSGGDATTDVYFDNMQLVRKDPSSAYPNPFQRFGQRDFSINGGEWFVGLENGEIVCRELSGASSGNYILGTKTYIDCTAHSIMKIYGGVGTFGTTWFMNSTNYLRVLCSGGLLYLQRMVGGVNTETTTSYSVENGDVLEFMLAKNGANVFVRVIKNGDRNNPTELTTTAEYTGAGYLAIMGATGKLVNIQSASIANTEHAHHANIAEVAKEVVALPYYNSKLASDVSMYTADTWYDAVSLTLPAGTWFLSGVATVVRGSATATTYTARISDGTNHYASAANYRTSVASNITSLPLSTVIVLTASTTIKLQCVANVTSTTIMAAALENPAGNNATQLTAVKIGS